VARDFLLLEGEGGKYSHLDVARDFLLLVGEGGKYSHLDVARDFLLLEGEGENIVILMWRGISFSLREKGKI
jgi:hypothetical protein